VRRRAALTSWTQSNGSETRFLCDVVAVGLVSDQLGAKRALQQQVAGAQKASGGNVCY
jgi:hypothetical protein